MRTRMGPQVVSMVLFLILSVSAQKHTGWGGGNDRNGDPAINIIIGEPKKKERTVVNRAGWGVKEEGRPEGEI